MSPQIILPKADEHLMVKLADALHGNVPGASVWQMSGSGDISAFPHMLNVTQPEYNPDKPLTYIIPVCDRRGYSIVSAILFNECVFRYRRSDEALIFAADKNYKQAAQKQRREADGRYAIDLPATNNTRLFTAFAERVAGAIQQHDQLSDITALKGQLIILENFKHDSGAAFAFEDFLSQKFGCRVVRHVKSLGRERFATTPATKAEEQTSALHIIAVGKDYMAQYGKTRQFDHPALRPQRTLQVYCDGAGGSTNRTYSSIHYNGRPSEQIALQKRLMQMVSANGTENGTHQNGTLHPATTQATLGGKPR